MKNLIFPDRLDPNTLPKFLVYRINPSPTGRIASIHTAGTIGLWEKLISDLVLDRDFMQKLSEDDRWCIECMLSYEAQGK